MTTNVPSGTYYRFKGEDGSLGYRIGKTYWLTTEAEGRYPVVIELFGGGGRCPYESVEAFYRNWEPMLHIGTGPGAVIKGSNIE